MSPKLEDRIRPAVPCAGLGGRLTAMAVDRAEARLDARPVGVLAAGLSQRQIDRVDLRPALQVAGTIWRWVRARLG